jgi:hypothetical protein
MAVVLELRPSLALHLAASAILAGWKIVQTKQRRSESHSLRRCDFLRSRCPGSFQEELTRAEMTAVAAVGAMSKGLMPSDDLKKLFA